MTKKEWKEILEARRRELAVFEEESKGALEAARALVGRWTVLRDSAREFVPPGHIRCEGFSNNVSCDEIVEIIAEIENVQAAGWAVGTCRRCCLDIDGEWFCPAHRGQAVGCTECAACVRDSD